MFHQQEEVYDIGDFQLFLPRAGSLVEFIPALVVYSDNWSDPYVYVLGGQPSEFWALIFRNLIFVLTDYLMIVFPLVDW